MNEFDKSVNFLLENLIFEQDQSEIDPNQVIDQTLSDIKTRLKDDAEKYQSESEAKYMAGDSILPQIEKYISSFPSEQISEETGLESMWSSAKEAGSAAWDWAKKNIAPTMHDVGEAVSDKVGEYAVDLIGKEYVDDIQKNMSESIWYKIAAVLEPTGIMSWPYYKQALDLYEKNKGTEDEDIYFLNMIAAQISVIPTVRVPLGILTFPLRLFVKVPTKIGRYAARKSGSFLRNLFSKETSALKASSKLESVAVKKGLLGKAKDLFGKILKGSAQTAKIVAPTAKAITVASSGDIPKKMKEWLSAGEQAMKEAKPQERTLGKFPSFGQLSTQRF